MSNKNGDGKPLRFASLIRVSTEKQEEQGESLRTQEKSNLRDVERLGGTIVERYGGQEHATPTWEKKEVDRLIADAVRGKFDAVIVAYADRWSRDSAKSKEGLQVFRNHGIRFFVGSKEQDLFDPQVRLFLGMSAEIGEFLALVPTKKSFESRIERAKRGIPTSGKLPFGRTFDKETSKWGLDANKHAMIADIAARYVAETETASLPQLAQEYDFDHSRLCQILRHECGPTWVVHFRSEDLNIDESVTFHVPELLDPKTIRRLRAQLDANRTNKHGQATHAYLLNGYIFCAACGSSLTGQPTKRGDQTWLYYRHASRTEAARNCPRSGPLYPRADKIEKSVIADLFDLFGNPAAVERAVKRAVPNCEALAKQREWVEKKLAKTERSKLFALKQHDECRLTDAEAEKKLAELAARQTGLLAERDKLAGALADVVNVEQLDEVLDIIEREPGKVSVIIQAGENASDNYDSCDGIGLLNMLQDPEDLRHLIRSAFAAPQPDGKPAGVYVATAADLSPQAYRYQLRGRLFGFHLHGRLIPRVTRRIYP
jgi:DNA invertase Pin-like site-specific DNA recombinase